MNFNFEFFGNGKHSHYILRQTFKIGLINAEKSIQDLFSLIFK